MPKQPKPPEESHKPREQPANSHFLKISDLAERWGVSVADAKNIVRGEKVPFLSLRTPRPGSMRLCWKFVRFELEAVEAWEARRRSVVAVQIPPKPLLPAGHRPILRSRSS